MSLTFAQQMGLEKARISEKMRDTYVGTVRAFCEAVINKTPRDTGALKGAWKTSTQLEFITKDNARLDDENGTLAKNENASVMATTNLNTVVFFTNGMHYVEFIEWGWSKQSPQGMLAITMLSFPSIAMKAWQGSGRDLRYA